MHYKKYISALIPLAIYLSSILSYVIFDDIVNNFDPFEMGKDERFPNDDHVGIK